jgi:hypothetical protein
LSCEKIIQTLSLQQIVETNAEKKKWRQVIISKIKPKPFFDRLWKALANYLDAEIPDDCAKFFERLKERFVSYTREHKRDSNFQFPPRAPYQVP